MVDGDRSPEQNVLGTGGPYAASDPGTARAGRGHGQRVGGALRAESARRLQAPQGTAAGRAGHAGAEGAVAALPAGGGAAQGGRRLGGALSPLLGREVRPPGRLSTRGAKREADR